MFFPLLRSVKAALSRGRDPYGSQPGLRRVSVFPGVETGLTEKCGLCRDFWSPEPVGTLLPEGDREWRWYNLLECKLGIMPVKSVNVLLFKTRLKLDSSCIYGRVPWPFAVITQRSTHL